mgnify:CR=1 FL=1
MKRERKDIKREGVKKHGGTGTDFKKASGNDTY